MWSQSGRILSPLAAWVFLFPPVFGILVQASEPPLVHSCGDNQPHPKGHGVATLDTGLLSLQILLLGYF